MTVTLGPVILLNVAIRNEEHLRGLHDAIDEESEGTPQ